MSGAVSLVVVIISVFFVLFAFGRLFKWLGKWRISRRLDHTQLEEVADEISKATRAAALLGSAAAYSLAPTGIAALGVKIGLVSVPLIVLVAPKLGIVAAVALAASCIISLYAKHRRRKESSS